MVSSAFVPPAFVPPSGLDHEVFCLRRLDVAFNERDFAAWSSSIDHIRRTPGFDGRDWPREMSLNDNRTDLEMHAADFQARRGFTYTVLDRADGDVIGCVYIYPAADAGIDAAVRSWVRISHAHLDPTLVSVIRGWLTEAWPFSTVAYR